MVVWFSLKTEKKYKFQELKELLKKLIHFHAYQLNYYATNAGDQILLNTDALLEDLNWRSELLEEQFELLKKPYFKSVDLSHIFTISSFDANNGDTYKYVDDPTKAKQRTANQHFNQLIAKHPKFESFQLQNNYEY